MEIIMTDISIRITVLENLIKDGEERLAFYTERRNALAIQDSELVAMHIDPTIGEITGLLKGRRAELETLKVLLTNLHNILSAQNDWVEGRGEGEEGDGE